MGGGTSQRIWLFLPVLARSSLLGSTDLHLQKEMLLFSRRISVFTDVGVAVED